MRCGAARGPLAPYRDAELTTITRDSTLKKDAAREVEREIRSASPPWPWSTALARRVLRPAIEGMPVRGQQGLDVGDRVRVTLVRTDIEQGYIDFVH